MKKKRKIQYGLLSLILLSMLVFACEYSDPFPDPSGSFEVWGINPETNAYEKVEEPYTLTAGQKYDYIISGSGQQFVIWFGVAGDTSKTSPTGSDFNDRGINHFSTGKVVPSSNRLAYVYRSEGEYEMVLVSSSFSYTRDEYKEVLLKTPITVVP